jgi:N-acetylglutamate synthase-like GNAT family acetyltransferase
MTEFIVRIATAADDTGVSALLDASYSTLLRGHYENELLAVALPQMTKADPHLLASRTYYVAITADEEFVGCGGWTLEQPGSGEIESGVAHIRHFATHPRWVGKGIGKALLSRCIRDAEKRSIQTLECFSTLNAAHFYGSAGFERIRAIEVPLAQGTKFPAIHMMRAAGRPKPQTH